MQKVREAARRLGKGEEAGLPDMRFDYFPTPTRSDSRNRGSPAQLLRRYIPLSCRARMLPGGGFDRSGGRTNPEWVEWLMGWPMSWTDLRPLATDRFRTWLRGLSPTSGEDSGNEP